MSTNRRLLIIIITIIGAVSLGTGATYLIPVDRNKEPYPLSDRFSEIVWKFDKMIQMAPGSDLWPTTWGEDNAVYTSWGDGGGFNGTNQKGRVSLGFGKIEGNPPDINPINIWGGKDGICAPTFKGKCAGMISVEGVLYGWINSQNGVPPDYYLAWSEDGGCTWKLSEWSFPGSGDFFPSTFLNYGKDNTYSQDNYVYSYGAWWIPKYGAAENLYLLRVPKKQIRNRSAYQFFAGINDKDQPLWTEDVNQRRPVFTDENGVGNPGLASVIYNHHLDIYLMMVGHRGSRRWIEDAVVGRLGVFEAPNPWGPWKTIAYYDNWGEFEKGDTSPALVYNVPVKWIRDNGLSFWIVFSSTGKLDAFNLLPAKLIVDKKY